MVTQVIQNYLKHNKKYQHLNLITMFFFLLNNHIQIINEPTSRDPAF